MTNVILDLVRLCFEVYKNERMGRGQLALFRVWDWSPSRNVTYEVHSQRVDWEGLSSRPSRPLPNQTRLDTSLSIIFCPMISS